MEMLTDNPISNKREDKLGFSDYAQLLAQTIIDTKKLPFCIGIFGGWGTGKSSLMNLIKEELDERKDIKTIWFNPWKYDNRKDVLNALLQSILYSMASQSKDRQVKYKAKRLAKEVAWIATKSLISLLSHGSISADSINKIKDIVTKNDQQFYKHINKFEDNFEKIVNIFVGDSGILVVFIDDLDRCLPENAIMVLESLKLYIGNAKCVFVLGMDYNIVDDGIKVKYPHSVNITGRDYIDKIIQVPFYLPPVPFDKLKTAFIVRKSLDYSDKIWKLLEYGLDNNPRKIKRFINSYYFMREIINRSEMTSSDNDNSIVLEHEIQYVYCAKLLIIQMRFQEFYYYLKQNPDSWWILEKQILNKEYNNIKDEMLNEKPGLRNFLDNEIFIQFMDRTRTQNFYKEPPNKEIVKSLMNAIGLTTPNELDSSPYKVKKDSASSDKYPSTGSTETIRSIKQ